MNTIELFGRFGEVAGSGRLQKKEGRLPARKPERWTRPFSAAMGVFLGLDEANLREMEHPRANTLGRTGIAHMVPVFCPTRTQQLIRVVFIYAVIRSSVHELN